MAHFAQLDTNNKVTNVIVVNNTELLNQSGIEEESIGIKFCKSIFGEDSVWVQTSYNSTIRKNYACIGDTYDVSRDAFIAPQPYPSWNLNENTCGWQPPVLYPTDGKLYKWNEEALLWVNMVESLQ